MLTSNNRGDPISLNILERGEKRAKNNIESISEKMRDQRYKFQATDIRIDFHIFSIYT